MTAFFGWMSLILSVLFAAQYRKIARLDEENFDLRSTLDRARINHAADLRYMDRPTLYSLDMPPGWHIFDPETAQTLSKMRGWEN